METNRTDSTKINALQQLYDLINSDIERDFAQPIVYKGRPKWMGGDGVIKLDKEREEERKIQLHRKYDERVGIAINIWETFPDCSEPPMSNPSPKIGLQELKVWAKKELEKEVSKNNNTGKGEEVNMPQEIEILQEVIQTLDDWNKEDAEFSPDWGSGLEARNRIDIMTFLGDPFIGHLDTLHGRYNLPNKVKERHDDFVSYTNNLKSDYPDSVYPEEKLNWLRCKAGDLHSELKRYENELIHKVRGGTKPQGKGGESEINSQFLSIAKESVMELIKRGESHYIEFKASLEYDIDKNQHNKDLSRECLKTIAAFLNADGGVLLIGVQDNGAITGIEKDLQYVQRKKPDGFELKLRSLMTSHFKPNPLGKVKISFDIIEETVVCRIEINPVNFDQIINFDNEVYVREGNTTVKLFGSQLTDWIMQRKKTVSVIPENHYERNQRTDSRSEMQLYGKGGIVNHKTEQDSKEKKEGTLEAKPPEILQKILWCRLHGRKHWKIILVAILLLLGASLFVLPQFNIISLISKIIKSIHF